MPKLNRKIFISHSSEDGEIAVLWKDLIEHAFESQLKVFTSSSARSLSIGTLWKEEVWENLRTAGAYIVVLSPVSLVKPWVIFEAGAAFGSKVPLIPVLVNGLKHSEVEAPLDDYQGKEIDSTESIEVVINELSEIFNCRYSRSDSLRNLLMEKCAAEMSTDAFQPPSKRSVVESETPLLIELRAELNAISDERKDFWEILGRAYGKYFRGVAGLPDGLDALAELVAPPIGVPVKPGEHILNFPSQNGRHLTARSSKLFEFCSAVYPRRNPKEKLASLSIIPTEDFERFHTARGKHAKFWEHWASRMYKERVISLDGVADELNMHARMVNVLTYLEIALTQWTQDLGPGKQWLFLLNNHWLPRIMPSGAT